MKKVLKAISTICIIGGIMLLLGTAGASDNGGIEISQILTQAAISLGALLLGCGIRTVVL
jgi:hypothetical protein